MAAKSTKKTGEKKQIKRKLVKSFKKDLKKMKKNDLKGMLAGRKAAKVKTSTNPNDVSLPGSTATK